MDFSTVTKIVIPEGEVTRITSGSTILWEKSNSGDSGNNYTGTITASDDTTIVLNLAADFGYGASYRFKSLTLTRTNTSTTNCVINKVTYTGSNTINNSVNGTATYYYDGTNTGSVIISAHGASTNITGLEIDSSELYDVFSEDIVFNGTYNYTVVVEAI